MKRILLTSWAAEMIRARLPFMQRRAPWYVRYARTDSPWVPVGLIVPLALYFIWRGARLLIDIPAQEDAQ